MSEAQRDLDRIIEAWINAGPAPLHHLTVQKRLRKDWPTLANAIAIAVHHRSGEQPHPPSRPR